MKIVSLLAVIVFIAICEAFPEPQGGVQVEASKDQHGKQVGANVFHDWGTGKANVHGQIQHGQGGKSHNWGGNVNQQVWRSNDGRSRAEVFGGFGGDSAGSRSHNYGGRFSHTWGG